MTTTPTLPDVNSALSPRPGSSPFSFAVPGIALLILLVTFLSGGDTATGLGRVGVVALILGVTCLIGFGGLQTQRRLLPRLNRPVIALTGAGLLIVGIMGLMLEGPTHNSQAETFKKSGKFEQAISEYRKGGTSNLKTNIPQTYLLQGDQQLKDKNYEAALNSYRKVWSDEFTPNSFSETAKKQIGATYLAWGQQLESETPQGDTALAKYDEVIKDGANNEALDTAKNQARTLTFKQGDSELGSTNFDKALSLYQKAASAYGATEADLKIYQSKTYLAWGQKLLVGNDFDGALGKLEPNLKAAADGDVANYNAAIIDSYAGLGQKLLADKKYEDALSRLIPALSTYGKLDSKNRLQSLIGQALTGQGANFESAKNYAKAIESYEKALTYTPAKTDLNERLTRVYTAQGADFEAGKNFVKAIGSYEKALGYANGAATNDLKGKLVNVYSVQSEDLLGKGQFKNAIDSYQQALKQYASDANKGQLRNGIAKAYLRWADQAEKDGDFTSALTRYRLILSDYSDQPDYTGPASEAQPRVIFKQAGKLVSEGNYEKAISTYQDLINQFGNSNYARDARNLLAASQDVTVLVTDKSGKALPNLKVQLVEKWVTDGPGSYKPTGRTLDFTTDGSGKFTAKLAPGQEWLLSFWKEGNYVASFYVKDNAPANLVSSSQLRATSVKQAVNIA